MVQLFIDSTNQDDKGDDNVLDKISLPQETPGEIEVQRMRRQH